MHQLDRVARGDADLPERRPAHDVAIVLDHDGAWIERQIGEQLEQGNALRNRLGLPVDDDVDRVLHRSSSKGYLLSGGQVLARVKDGSLILRDDGDYKVNQRAEFVSSQRFESVDALISRVS